MSELKEFVKPLDFGEYKDAYYNLMGAIRDIEGDKNNRADGISMDTLNRVLRQLGQLHENWEKLK